MTLNEMKQTSIFDFMFEKKLIKKPIRIIELFGGYGSQYMALKYLGANVESYKLVEWEVAAIEAYTRFHHEYKHFDCDDLTSALYNLGISNDGKVPMTLQQIERRSDEWKQKVYNNIRSSNNLVNILTTKGKDLEIVEKDKYEYIMTYSFPCQDLSLAGKGAGLGEGTRSGLLWQVERILLELKELNELPQILLMENVPMILSPKYRDDFAKWDLALSKLGYKSYVKNLMATDYLIPQIRNRTFMISILGEYSYSFPNKLKKEYILKDFLENNVDEKYFLSDKMMACFTDMTNRNGFVRGEQFKPHTIDSEYAYTITTRAGQRASDNFVIIPEKTKKGYAVVKDTRNLKEKLCDELIESGILKEGDVINHSYTNSGKNPNSRLSLEDFIETTDGTIPTLTTRGDTLGVVVREEYQGMYQYSKSDKFMKGKDRFTKNKEFADTIVTTQKEGVVVKNEINGLESLRTRKLTPKECFRLMGVKDRDYEKIADFSNSSLYRLAGNSIVIQVLMGIFGELLGIDYKKKIKESVKEIV
jgi:DNA (cytosine-5)-methyltransferase 1